MENTQETNAAYIAGIVDGEGSIMMHWRQYRQGKWRLDPHISIANTSPMLVEHIDQLLNLWNIPHFISWQSLKVGKPRADIGIVRYNGIKNLLEILIPYLVIKKARGIAVHEFVQGRLLPDGRGKKNGIKDPYTLRDFELLAFVKKENGKQTDLDPQRLYAEYASRKVGKPGRKPNDIVCSAVKAAVNI